MTDRKHERSVCMAVARFLAQQKEQSLAGLEWLEDQEREKPSVELRFSIGASVYVLEHTRIESFPGQITDNHQFTNLLGPLEKSLSGKLPTPGYYWLCVAPGAVKGIRNAVQVRTTLERWVLLKAPTLVPCSSPIVAPRHFVIETPPWIPFEVGLYRWEGTGQLDGRLLLVRFSPRDVESQRSLRIKIAFDAKCPKLAAAKGDGCASVLVLESNDITLANSAVIGDALVKELQSRSHDIPDVIHLVETEVAPWVIWVLKEDEVVFPRVPSGGPHYVPLELHQPVS